MKEEEFREWLESRRYGGKPLTTVANRLSYVRRFEQMMPKLGFAVDDLDDAYDHDALHAVFDRFYNWQKDAKGGIDIPNEVGGGSSNPLGKLSNYWAAIGNYYQFRQGKGGWKPLLEMRDRFHAQCPDFESFEDPGSGWVVGEREYKVAASNAIKSAIRTEPDPEKLGKVVFDILKNAAPDGPLVRWQTEDSLIKGFPESLPKFYGAIGRLVRSEEAPADALESAFESLASLKADGVKPLTFGEQANIVFTSLAMARPMESAPIKINMINEAAEILIGKKILQEAFNKQVYFEFAELFERTFEVMCKEWVWKPRDWFDVQGFLWIALKYENDLELTDDELLHQFDSCDYFRTRRAKWTDEQTASFCRMARKVHDLGLDWYRTGIPQIRFGRKEKGASRASATLASFDAAPGRIRFTHSARDLGLTGLRYDCDPEGEHAFYELLDQKKDEIESWMPPVTKREGFWPTYNEGDVVEEASVEDVRNDAGPTNLILYGPPGTGKTYHTMEVAVSHCGEFPARDRDELREQYERLRKEKRIEFVTFHQNFSYEEFVEGLRPETGSESDSAAEGFKLEPKAGIFRQLCTRADEARKAETTGPSINLDGRKVFKMSLGRAGVEDEIFEDAWEGDYVVLGWGGDIDWSDYDSYQAIHDRWNADHPGTHGSDSNIAQVNRFVVDMKPGDIVVVSYGNSKIRAIAEVVGPYQFAPTETREYSHRRSVRWLRRFDSPIDASIVSSANFSQKSCYPIREANLDREGLATLLPSGNSEDGVTKQFVLVIDEINRANISKVFGELITLIEPDKRLGMDEELSVRLPYSNDVFGVPANLHLIGTMNTADRSIMQIDTALRRRFRFEEMEPDSSLLRTVDGVDLRRVLDTINARIEYLLDRDHAVGHAFFMNDGGKDRAAIDDTMRFKIIPLLQEYFFDDWRNIAAVLGAGFVSGKTLAVPPGIEDRGERTRWTIRWQEDGNSGFPEDAYDLLLRGTEAEVDQEDSPELDDMDDADEEV